MSQIALPLAWPEDGRDAEFIVGQSNAAAVRLLERWASWPVRTAILAGPPCSGRSTLARIFAARTGAEVIDDAQDVAEDTLFHAWNVAQTGRAPLLLVTRQPPHAWHVVLPDLRSRLGACPIATIEPPDDELVARLLERGLERHRLDARADVIAWLTARVERSHAAVAEMVDLLADAATATRRRLSIPMVRATLAEAAALTSRSDRE